MLIIPAKKRSSEDPISDPNHKTGMAVDRWREWLDWNGRVRGFPNTSR